MPLLNVYGTLPALEDAFELEVAGWSGGDGGKGRVLWDVSDLYPDSFPWSTVRLTAETGRTLDVHE